MEPVVCTEREVTQLISSLYGMQSGLGSMLETMEIQPRPRRRKHRSRLPTSRWPPSRTWPVKRPSSAWSTPSSPRRSARGQRYPYQPPAEQHADPVPDRRQAPRRAGAAQIPFPADRRPDQNTGQYGHYRVQDDPGRALYAEDGESGDQRPRFLHCRRSTEKTWSCGCSTRARAFIPSTDSA